MPIPVGKKRNSAHAAGDFSRNAAFPPVVLITGASSGFGEACAQHLGTKGYRVYGTSRRATWNPDYAANFARALAVMEKAERQGPSPEKLARLVARIITHPAPRLRYTAGTVSQRFGALLKRVLPGRLFEWLMMATYKLN